MNLSSSSESVDPLWVAEFDGMSARDVLEGKCCEHSEESSQVVLRTIPEHSIRSD